MSDETRRVVSDAFARRRADLVGTLPDSAPVDDARRALRDVFERLAADGADAAADPIEAERVKLAIDMARGAVLGALACVRRPEAPPPPRREEEHRGGVNLPLIGRVGGSDKPPQREEFRPPPPPLVYMPALLEQVAAACEAADSLLAAAEPPPPERVRVPWEEDEDLMDLVHNLLAAHFEHDPELAMRHIAHLEQHLVLAHEIRAVPFDEANGRFFAYVENTDRADARVITTRPALVTPERVVRRGEVRGPARAAAAPAEPDVPADADDNTPNQEGPNDDRPT